MGSSYFTTHSTQNADWTRHWLANGTAFIYNMSLIKKWMDLSFDMLPVDSGHPDALDSRMSSQLSLLFPQWHPVVNLDREETKRVRIRCGYKESKIERLKKRNRECVLALGTPAESKWISQHTIDPGTVTTILYLRPPTSRSESLHLLLSLTVKIKFI